MRSYRLALTAIVSAVIGLASPAGANTLTFQGVTFETLASGNTLQLTITNALSGGTGNWTDINYLQAFEIKNVGDVTGATLSGWSTTVDQGLAANNVGCNTGGTPGACFFQIPAIQLTDSMTFSMTFSGTGLDFSAPSLKVQFLTNINDTKPTGDLLSQTIPVPEPEIYAMMGIGLGFMSWAARRKKQKEAAAG